MFKRTNTLNANTKYMPKNHNMINDSKLGETYFGKNLKYLRKSNKKTLIALSKDLHVSKSSISDYETNKSTPGLDIVQKLSAYFSISIDDLYHSDLEKISAHDKKRNTLKRQDPTLLMDIENDKYIFNIKLITQKLESTQLQIQMLQQLLLSKEAENKTLKINIKLLEAQVKNFKND